MTDSRMPDRPEPQPQPRPGGTEAEWELIDRYLAGEASSEEAQRVERLLAERTDLAALVAALRATLAVKPEGDPIAGWDADAASARLTRTIQGDAGVRHRLAPPLRIASRRVEHGALDVGRSLRRSPLPWIGIAAATALVVGGRLFWPAPPPPKPAVTVAPPRVYATQRGQRTELRLLDGTRVMLAAESRLSVPVSFDGVRREVTLEGEAYFEVTHDSTKPFTVFARHGIIRDLGTRFDIRAYPERPDVQVVVAEGKVELGARRPRSSAAGRATVLTHGQLGQLDSTGTTIVRSGVNVARYTGWINGRLAFDEAPLGQVAAQLGRWYDLDITLADLALESRRVTLLLHEQSVAKILDAIALVTHARYERIGRRVRLFDDQVHP